MHNVLEMSDSPRAVFLEFKERQSPKLADRCTQRDADIFWLRFERYFGDVYYPLQELYGDRPEQSIMLLANFDDNWQSVNADILHKDRIVGNVRNLLAEEKPLNISSGRLHLEPYESMWLVGDA